MLTTKINLPLPGGFSTSGQDTPNELAAGVVGESGKVLDQAGNPVAVITEGEPLELVGAVVASTGEVINGDGEVVGRAEALPEEEAEIASAQPEQVKGGVDVESVASNLESTRSTANKVSGLASRFGGSIFGSQKGGDSEAGQEKPPVSQIGDEADDEASRAGVSELAGSEVDASQAEKEVKGVEGGGSISLEDGSQVNDKENDEQTEKPATSQADDDFDDAEGGAPTNLGDQSEAADTFKGTGEDAPTNLEAESQADDTTKDTKEEGATNSWVQSQAVADSQADKTVKDAGEGAPTNLEDQSYAPTRLEDQSYAPTRLEDQSYAPTRLEDSSQAPVDGEQEPASSQAGDTVKDAEEGAPTNLDDQSQAPEDGEQEEPTGEEGEEKEEEEPIDYSVLKDCKCTKSGNVVNKDGIVMGRVIEGKLKELDGLSVDENGDIYHKSGNIIGKAEPVEQEEEEPIDYSVLKDCKVTKSGNVVNQDGIVMGRVVEGKLKELDGLSVDENGDIYHKSGKIIGKAEPVEQDEQKEEEPIDYSVLKDCKINKAGNVINSAGAVIGHVSEGKLADLVGRKVDENGDVWNDSGKVIGKAVPADLQESKEPSPFEDFPDAVVESNGTVTSEGSVIGRVIEGDAKKLKGKKVDEDGDILDRAGNVLGKAERWEEEEPEPEPEVVIDNSALAGKRVNKVGNIVDPAGTIYGRLVEGDPKRLAGRMCDKDGNIRSESGDVVGRAELVTEGEREGVKDGPFAELPGCTVTKDGKVVTSAGDIVGRLTQGEGAALFGRAVDEDGDVLDRNGNTIGKAERWEEPVEEVSKNPMCGRKVNREGNVVDPEGNIIGKLTSGELSVCAGKAIDNDGDVVDGKGTTVGHASLIEDIPEPEPSETPEEKAKREQDEEDEKLAKRMAACLTGCLDKIRPICAMITDKTDKAERTPAEELDEEALVKEVRPLIEEGNKILQEANGIIRGLDPEGRVQANAKHKTAAREASGAEYHLAELLKELTGTVSACIDGAKRKIEDMPHAKKELNPMWALLTEPLGQIIAAVGLLLNGVLELVGRLLNGLGLGGLVNNLLGGLGLTSVLKGLGIGGVVDSLTGQKPKKK